MKEVDDILNAFERARNQNVKSVLATVVYVEGSSYRRPGARMLIAEDGSMTGAISGGCLEKDALRNAFLAMYQNQNKLVKYDTTDEDDIRFGVQLGCNGVVHILFEPLLSDVKNHPILLLKTMREFREEAVLVTLFSMTGNVQPGTGMLYTKGQMKNILPSSIQLTVQDEIIRVLEKRCSSYTSMVYEQKNVSAFLQFIPPPVSLVIAGAGNDVIPLMEISTILGWNVTIIDGGSANRISSRFAKANRILIGKPEEVRTQLTVDSKTMFVLMTHNYNYDLALLKELSTFNIPYLGILGPKKRLERLLFDLHLSGITISGSQRSCIFAPVGLDIGAETAEEIATSIVAEILAISHDRSAISLKAKEETIHTQSKQSKT